MKKPTPPPGRYITEGSATSRPTYRKKKSYKIIPHGQGWIVRRLGRPFVYLRYSMYSCETKFSFILRKAPATHCATAIVAESELARIIRREGMRKYNKLRIQRIQDSRKAYTVPPFTPKRDTSA